MSETTPAPSSRQFFLRLALMSLGGAALAAFLLFMFGKPAQPPASVLADYGQLPEFNLIERSEKDVTRDSLTGYIWVADFMFTNCAGPCPRMTAEMARLQDILPLKKGIKLVSFSVDPERDTPEVLSKYATEAGARPGSWLFLTGEKSAIQELAVNGFHIGSKDDAINHSTRFALVDRKGHVRGYYDSTDRESLAKLVDDSQQLIQEQ
jgi:protein SCO1/2